MKKILLICMAAGALLLASCVKDDGNYDYTELPEITVEGLESQEVLAFIDTIKVHPIITSSTEGVITPDNPNYKIQYRIGYKGMGAMTLDDGSWAAFKDITPAKGFDLVYPASLSTGTYLIWFTITDLRNNVTTSKTMTVSVGSTTYEGWLVLCNEGQDETVRLDMITKLNSTTITEAYNIATGMPTLHHATCINMYPSMCNPGDAIHLFSKEGAYDLDPETMETNPDLTFEALTFAFPVDANIIKEDQFNGTYYDWMIKYHFCFADNGNAYLKMDGIAGASYALPINTETMGSNDLFHVAPYCGYNWVRPWAKGMPNNVIFYDTDNRRFMVFMGHTSLDYLDEYQMVPIADPSADETKLFSYNTGKDFVYMQSTRRSNGDVYTILQDPATGKRSIYGINLGTATPTQSLYVDVEAPDFEKATQFAFDTRFPILFYSVGSKLYLYNYASKQAKEINAGLNGEEITFMKFNLYRASSYDALANQSEEFMNQQYRLIVASYDGTKNGGKVTFYDVDGTSNNLTKGEQYTGFAKVVDIIYRERQL
ncbi:MAG: PKD-like family lipoprotein [Bacteroidaceae bacterium]|nr:PKD-like family lipoprotein [Bacteroidaceae bacterium]